MKNIFFTSIVGLSALIIGWLVFESVTVPTDLAPVIIETPSVSPTVAGEGKNQHTEAHVVSQADSLTNATPQISYTSTAVSQEALIDKGVAGIKNDLKKILNIEGDKLDNVTSLVRAKIIKDREMMAQLETLVVDSEVTVLELDATDAELNAQQLAVREAINTKAKEVIEGVDRNRIEYEDAMKNHLSHEEIEQYQKMERETVAKAQSDHMRSTVDRIKEASSLSVEQVNQMDELVRVYESQELGDIPFGSVVNVGSTYNMASNKSSMEFFMNFQSDIMGVLSPEQIESYKNAFYALTDNPDS